MPASVLLTMLTLPPAGCSHAEPGAAAPPAARPAPDWMDEAEVESGDDSPAPDAPPAPVDAEAAGSAAPPLPVVAAATNAGDDPAVPDEQPTAAETGADEAAPVTEPDPVPAPADPVPEPADPDPDPEPVTADPAPAVVEPAAPAPAPAASPVEALLEELEESGRTLETFTANVWYRIDNEFVGRPETRIGELLYTRGSGPARFAILFDQTIIGARSEKKGTHYVFDGQWLAEIVAEKKQFTKTQIVPPGRELDPLKLGEGPFPVPIGQPKQQVLARFDAALAEPPAEGHLAALGQQFELKGLRLVPKATTPEARDFERVDLFYDTKSMLPVGIVVTQTDGKIKTVRLTEPRRNPQLDAVELAKLVMSEPDPKEWAVVVQPWKDR